ncbi:Pycsar system effector family protein [Streptomyces tibetensis]|uniref:Pycsar system effector family protein n=1 Tax=Streptomyces tibetensis TaxID=2382123 RepID=UPI0033CF4DD7
MVCLPTTAPPCFAVSNPRHEHWSRSRRPARPGHGASAARRRPRLTRAAGALAMAALGAAAVLLLLVVRPRLGGHDRASFPLLGTAGRSRDQRTMTGDTRPARIHVLSRTALRKYRTLRRAVDCILAALALLALAAFGALL